jgi:hypothetical protein
VEIKSPVAKLQRVPLREIWGDEARNFTPWLATDDALSLLGEVIGRELELIGTEVAVGPYSADILAKAAGQEDHKVVIENQLGKTDHDHLGKMITYAAGLGAKTSFGSRTGSARSIEKLSTGLTRIPARSWISMDWRYVPSASMALAQRRNSRPSQSPIMQPRLPAKSCHPAKEGPRRS